MTVSIPPASIRRAGGLDERFGSSRLGGLHDARQHVLGRPLWKMLGAWPVRAGQVPDVLPHVDEGQVAAEHLGRERMAVPQGLRPRPMGFPRTVHRRHIFSMFTRNALNSGVRELASPTNGVSALASQC